MLAPEIQIRAVAEINIAEWCMTTIRRTAEHDKMIPDFSREKNPVSIEWQKSILKLMESFKIVSPRKTDSRPVIIVATSKL